MTSTRVLLITTLISTFILSSINIASANPQQPLQQHHNKTTDRADVKSFINEMVVKHNFNRNALTKLFAQAHLRPIIIKTIKHPHEANPWYKYKKIFLTPDRIQAGVTFWQQHQDTLARAEKQFGVPAKTIVGILGVETYYGTRKGKYLTLDALSTLAFNHPQRAHFFKSELEAFLLLTREQHFNPLLLKGSYAGALGYPQFMPSSYRDYAIDFSGDGKVDLIYNANDTIGSIANYLHKKGKWHANQPITAQATLSQQAKQKSLDTTAHTIAEFKQQGVVPLSPIEAQLKAKVFQIQEDTEKQTWLSLHNFRAILRYNPRINYGMAVYQLGEAIAKAHLQQQQQHSKHEQ